MSTLAQIKKSIWVPVMLTEESSLSLYWVGFVIEPVPYSQSLNPINNCSNFLRRLIHNMNNAIS
jgi:hypothetical protein